MWASGEGPVRGWPLRPFSRSQRMWPLCNKVKIYTKVFLDKDVRETRRRERGNARGGATNKREISRTSLSINPKILRTSYMEAPFESDNPSLRGEETKRVLSFVFHCFKILHKSLT